MADSWGSTPPHAPGTNKSGRKVMCVKFQKELPGLDAPPWPDRQFESSQWKADAQKLLKTLSAP